MATRSFLRLSALVHRALHFYRGNLHPIDRASTAVEGAGVERDPAKLFGLHRNRRARYQFWRLMAENVAYADEVSTIAPQLRSQYRTGNYIQPILNPTGRIVDFWADHIYAGVRDPEMGDGKKRPSSMPILADYEPLRPALAMVCDDSLWDFNQPLYTRNGAMLGDTALFSCNDPIRGRTTIEVVEPDNVIEYDIDPVGVPHHYLYAEWADDPRPDVRKPKDRGVPRPKVFYVEEADLVRDDAGQPVAVRFRTTLATPGGDEIPYGWHGMPDDWEEPYPALPLVLVPHMRSRTRSPFGRVEAAKALSKIVENDDVMSRFHSFVRKSVDPVVLLSGLLQPETMKQTVGGPDSMRAIFAQNPQATAKILLASLDLAALGGHADRLIKEVERDFPELQEPSEKAKGDTTGVALRTFYQGLTTKGQNRRVGYDLGFAAAMRMCLVQGGIMGYDGFEDWTPEALASDPGRLKFSIGERPLFKKDELDALDVDLKRWQIVESGERAGATTIAMMRLVGYGDDDVAMVEKERDKARQLGDPLGRQKQASPASPNAVDASQAPGMTTPVQDHAPPQPAQNAS